MDIQSLKVDSGKVAEGTWVTGLPGAGDLRLRVRGWNSPKAVALRSRLEREAPKSDRIRGGGMKPTASTRIGSQVLAEVVLLDWDGMTNGGEPMPYDADLARQWLMDPDFRQFADLVYTAATWVDQGQAEAEEEIAGNLPQSSGGASKIRAPKPAETS